MKKEVSISWKEGMAFEADVDGYKLMLDAAEKVGGRNMGPRPKPLMLVALAGCTGMDVVSILSKMKVELENFNVKVEGDQSEEHPVHYTSMHIIYEFWGENCHTKSSKKQLTFHLKNIAV